MTDRIIFSGLRAVGVAYLHKDQPQNVSAKREVLLCSGAIASPQILQRFWCWSRRLIAWSRHSRHS
ncbi:GMC family oxidoreductase N-terminal domain-containing protein [Polaromonas vacuolata]|uniref:GMC family oxidoreductase N-terminal domain-containing protein n=1 Tax=Polaromonas vacuolata TaxID=37448 RepID=UPI001EE2D7DB|nr:GMC family oxidoreductase N-terminal domain-containing protein [Polaromonas vacuolata]